MIITHGNDIMEIANIPDVEKPVLLIGNQYRGDVIATFMNEEKASEFGLFIQKFLGIGKKNGGTESCDDFGHEVSE